MGYKEDIKIDKYNLDEEWEKQPELYLKYSEKWAAAVGERDRAKERLDLTKAELDREIREKAEREKKKITETAIANAVILDPRCREAVRELIEDNESANVFVGVKEAFGHRKKALEKITDLFLANFFSKDYVSKEDKEREQKIYVSAEKEQLVMLRRKGRK